MYNPNIFFKRFYAGIIAGNGLIHKIKAAFGLVFISFISPVSLYLKKFNKNYKAHFISGSDVAMWVEVFFDEEYKLPDNFFPKKILDLGANAGFSSLYFALRDKGVSIISIEPDPNNFKLVQKNVASYSNIRTKQTAVASQKGERKFFSLKKNGMGSSFIKRPSADIIKVSAISIDDLLRELRWQEIDLVKFDIEGAEWEVFENAPLNQIKALIGEYHEDLTGHSVEDFLKLFSAFKHNKKMIYPKRYIIYFFR